MNDYIWTDPDGSQWVSKEAHDLIVSRMSIQHSGVIEYLHKKIQDLKAEEVTDE